MNLCSLSFRQSQVRLRNDKISGPERIALPTRNILRATSFSFVILDIVFWHLCGPSIGDH